MRKEGAGAPKAPISGEAPEPAEPVESTQSTGPVEAKGKDADGTRARILAAATDEFSANGYSGARIEAICRAARANPRMIYHYFGDKDGLYVAVLGQVLEELRSEEMKLAVDHTPPMQGMVELFDFIQDHFARRPQLVNILTGENLLRARFLKRSIKAPIVSSPLIELIAQLLDRGRRMGVFRPGINPLRLYVMMVALAYFHRSNAFTLSAIFRTDVSSADWQRQYRKDGQAMLRSYVSAQGQSTSTPRRKRSSNSK